METHLIDNFDIDKITSAIYGRRILFAHQSVGGNLIDGIKQLYTDINRYPPKLIPNAYGQSFHQPTLEHIRIGKNRYPKSKIDDFENLLNTHGFPLPEIAALKLCYVDVLGKESPAEIFTAYDNMTTRVKEKHPNLTLLHFTMPLTSDANLYHRAKHLIFNTPTTNSMENMLRNQYNELLKNRFGDDYIFDIANLESTSPKGDICTSTFSGKNYPCMCHKYTTDGGHLNQIGKAIISKQFLVTLANICLDIDSKNP